MHPSQFQLRIANLWKGAFKSELLLKVDEEIINFITATVLEAAINKEKSFSSKSHKPLNLLTFQKQISICLR